MGGAREAYAIGDVDMLENYQIFLDEDSTNDIDETPPDLHFAAGMHCADCHVGSDVHGDGRLYSTSKQQVDIRCEDCHGTVRQQAAADGGTPASARSGQEQD